MRITTAAVLLMTFALAACSGGDDAAEQNVVISNEVPANTDLEALPADESSATSTGELMNGADDNAVAEPADDANAAANSL